LTKTLYLGKHFKFTKKIQKKDKSIH